MSLGVFTFNHTDVLSSSSEKVSEVIEDAGFDTQILNVQFCGDTLPLKESLVAKRYQQAIQFYDHPSFSRLKARHKRQMKVIEPILEKYGIPSDFKYMPIIESSMNPKAVSPKGAAGYWQLMPATAEGLGLKVNGGVDERTDLIKSTHAAAKYLKWLYRELGNWTLVAAAYNAGPNRILRHMDQQKKDDYFSLILNKETTNYVYRLVAAKEWTNEPNRCEVWAEKNTVALIADFVERQQENINAIAMREAL